MIKEATKNHKKEIYELWKSSHAIPNKEYLDFYFQFLFDQGTCFIQEEEDRIVSTLQMYEHVLAFHNRKVAVNYLMGISTLSTHRRKGHMRSLMESALDESEHNYLFTFIRASNPRLYAAYGFDTVYSHKSYQIDYQELSSVTTLHTGDEASPSQLLKAYQKFSNRFDGFFVRNERYYGHLVLELKLTNKRMVVYTDPEQDVCGYLLYKESESDILIMEAVYLESIHLMRMLKAIAHEEKRMILEVSEKEHLEKIFSSAIPRTQGYMMVRINDYELFNKYFVQDANTPREAFALLKKPLWLHENY